VQRHFGGDRVLFETFRDGCVARFADDLAAGDAAVAGADAVALRRVAHGLKAVLELIGHAGLAAEARAIEDAAAQGVVDTRWAALARGLVELGTRRGA
jgi:HPt (histidine-containing phosphotransfer) domain-containing protein